MRRNLSFFNISLDCQEYSFLENNIESSLKIRRKWKVLQAEIDKIVCFTVELAEIVAKFDQQLLILSNPNYLSK
jgi:hypothetical protein